MKAEAMAWTRSTSRKNMKAKEGTEAYILR
jgi:hypothetical protein